MSFSSTHWGKQAFSWILLQKRKFIYGGVFLGVVGIVISYFFIFNVGREVNVPAIHFQEESLRSDLILPTDSVLLNRPQLIKTIEEALKTSTQNVGTNGIKTIALVGIGGSGKTTLARYYARQQKASVVAEVDAETKEGLSESFESLAKILSITEEDKKNLRKIQDIEFVKERDKQILLFVKEKLKKSPNWLLIYDNVKHFKDIHEYFPYDSGAWGNGRIIVITRDKNIQNNSYISSIIEVTELTPQEKLDLFIKIMESGMLEKYTPHQREQVNSFLKAIPPFPLDVSIAAYYLKMTKVPYEKYLEHVKMHRQDFAVIQENVIKEASDYTKTRYGIITLSLDNIIQTDPDFASLLLFVSLLNDQNIPRDLLNAYKNDIIVDNFIYHLKKYSLITRESTSPSLASPLFSIHPSTQEVSLDYLQKTLDLKNNREVLNGIVTTMENYIDKAINQEDTLKMKFLTSHVERMLCQPLMDLHMREALQRKLGHIYYYLNEYTKAKDLLERTLHELRGQNSNGYEEIAETLMYLGDVYSVLSNYEQARKLSEESLEIYQKHLSKNYLGTAKALAYLGNVYRRLGNYEKAKELCQQSLELYKQHDSKNSINYAWTLAHLGQAYKELGNYDKAKDLLEESLKIYKEKSPDNCLREAWILAHIGSVYRKLGDFEKAKTFLELSLDIYRKYFSENHTRTAWVLFLLGEVYKDLKDYDVAESYFLKSLAIYEKNYGKDHQENTKVLAKLAEVYLLKGQVDQGEELLNRALDISLKAQHPGSYLSLEALADLYFTKSSQAFKKGQDKEANLLKEKALDYLNQARHIMKKYFSEDSPQLQRMDKKLKDFEGFMNE
ncbi:tetratricopeptide repeat protein [Geitlerinema splendidum]|nr:tetratricopeptide repeat protein [Geitlerinema splendidum]